MNKIFIYILLIFVSCENKINTNKINKKSISQISRPNDTTGFMPLYISMEQLINIGINNIIDSTNGNTVSETYKYYFNKGYLTKRIYTNISKEIMSHKGYRPYQEIYTYNYTENNFRREYLISCNLITDNVESKIISYKYKNGKLSSIIKKDKNTYPKNQYFIPRIDTNLFFYFKNQKINYSYYNNNISNESYDRRIYIYVYNKLNVIGKYVKGLNFNDFNLDQLSYKTRQKITVKDIISTYEERKNSNLYINGIPIRIFLKKYFKGIPKYIIFEIAENDFLFYKIID